MSEKQRNRNPIFLAAQEGRAYDMGRMQSIFKADGQETAGKYSISEWWLEAHTTGPGAHSHPEDDVFFVIAGTMSFLIGDQWQDAGPGSFILVPGGIIHDFENRSASRAGIFNISVPGDFEENMPSIVEWFKKHPPTNTK